MKNILILLLSFITIQGFAQIPIDSTLATTTTRYNAGVKGVYIAVGTNTYTTTLTNAKVKQNDAVSVKFTNANSGASSWNGVIIKKLSSNSLVDLVTGDIQTGEVKRIRNNGTYYVIEGGGGSSTYGGGSPTTVTVGGITSGTAIAGNTYDALFQALLAPYVAPVFTSFSITGQTSPVEVGTTLSGSKTFTWAITLNSGTVATIDLRDNTASSTLLAGTPNDGTQAQTITTIQLNSSGATQSWKGIGNTTSPTGTINSANFVVTSYFIRFYGPVASSPTTSANVRALSTSAFHTGATNFNLLTGSTITKFVCALPPGVTISSVFDLDALGADITSSYVLTGTISVLDAGSTGRTYNIYEMNVGSAYSTSHRHSITTAN